MITYFLDPRRSVQHTRPYMAYYKCEKSHLKCALLHYGEVFIVYSSVVVIVRLRSLGVT